MRDASRNSARSLRRSLSTTGPARATAGSGDRDNLVDRLAELAGVNAARSARIFVPGFLLDPRVLIRLGTFSTSSARSLPHPDLAGRDRRRRQPRPPARQLPGPSRRTRLPRRRRVSADPENSRWAQASVTHHRIASRPPQAQIVTGLASAASRSVESSATPAHARKRWPTGWSTRASRRSQLRSHRPFANRPPGVSLRKVDPSCAVVSSRAVLLSNPTTARTTLPGSPPTNAQRLRDRGARREFP